MTTSVRPGRALLPTAVAVGPPPARQSARASDRRTPREFDDGDLAQRHLGGDPLAFGALVDRYQTRLLTFINRSIGDRERAEGLVQDVFIRVFRHLHRFKRTEPFATWIFTIASNVTKNALGTGRSWEQDLD